MASIGIGMMTDLLQKAVAAACDLPVEMQGEIAHLVLAYVDDAPHVFSKEDGPGPDGTSPDQVGGS